MLINEHCDCDLTNYNLQIRHLQIVYSFNNSIMCASDTSLQKVQGHRATGPHRAGVNADLTPSTGGPVGHACR